MSKRVFKKWMKTYRTVTEVDFQGVDQWEDGDVEIAFIEGYWSGRRDSISWLAENITQLRGFKTMLNKKVSFWQNKLDKALAKRGNREEIGGLIETPQGTLEQPKPRPPSMTKEVALCKFHAMTKPKKLAIMDKAMLFMEEGEGYSKDYAIACTVAEDKGMELR